MTITNAATPATPAPVLDAATIQLEQQVMRKVSRHLLGFLFLLFVFSFLDRINIGLAGLTMMQDLGLSGTQFGFATTLFYIAYIACSIPSNIVLARIGARKWIGSMMIAWGLASTATLFASGPASLYALRFLVGVTEAGFLPGMLLYLTYWFPSAYRARQCPVPDRHARHARHRHRRHQCDGQYRLGPEPRRGGLAEGCHAQLCHGLAVRQRAAGGRPC